MPRPPIEDQEWLTFKRDRDAIDAIHEVLDGTEWSIDMLDTIADVIRLTGRTLREPQ
jgi:hypothetical protein